MRLFRAPRPLAVSALLVAAIAVSACGDDDDDSSVDASVAVDTGVSIDTGSAIDAATSSADADTSSIDASSSVDADTSPDALISFDAMVGPDADPSACHVLGFGNAAVNLEQVGSLPAMTGGTIELGAYDAVAFKMITPTTTGTYRASWYFETSSTMQLLEQIALNGGNPPALVPKTLTWSSPGTSLMRTQTCGGTTSFTNGYRVRTDASGTFLDVRQNTIMFTFKKR